MKYIKQKGVVLLTACNDSGNTERYDISPLRNEEQVCQTTVHETVCVQGTVTITPKVESGPSMSFCVDEPFIGGCPGELKSNCVFKVGQRICVQIPIKFSATATAVEDGIVCGTPQTGPCPEDGVGCTFTIGFFRNNTVFTNDLITAAGGSITLGGAGGLSFTVNTTNANDVLSFNTPSPPAPEDPPFAQQYQVLYAQLLAAKLNVLNLQSQDIEICTFATNAITAADMFLVASPSGGMAGAPVVQEPLEQFNSGNAPGCPPHCDG